MSAVIGLATIDWFIKNLLESLETVGGATLLAVIERNQNWGVENSLRTVAFLDSTTILCFLLRPKVPPVVSGRRFLLRPRPLPVLVVTGGGYVGYEYYRTREREEDGKPAAMATPTQVRGSRPPDGAGMSEGSGLSLVLGRPDAPPRSRSVTPARLVLAPLG